MLLFMILIFVLMTMLFVLVFRLTVMMLVVSDFVMGERVLNSSYTPITFLFRHHVRDVYVAGKLISIVLLYLAQFTPKFGRIHLDGGTFCDQTRNKEGDYPTFKHNFILKY